MTALQAFVRALLEFRERTGGREPRRIAVSRNFVEVVIEQEEDYQRDAYPLGHDVVLLLGHTAQVVHQPTAFFIFWD